MTKIKKAIALFVAAMLMLFMCAWVATPAYAEEVPPVTEEAEGEQETDFVDEFLKFLRTQYGDEYDYYYNRIIDEWGSVEAYLLSLGEKLPEEYKTAWQIFVDWLGEYSVVWAPALAVILIILAGVIGKKQFKIIVERTVNAKISPIVQELNLQSDATVSIMRSQKALLSTNEKFAENVKDLDECERRLMGDE